MDGVHIWQDLWQCLNLISFLVKIKRKEEILGVASNSCRVHTLHTLMHSTFFMHPLRPLLINPRYLNLCVLIRNACMQVIVNQIEPLTEQQIVGICGLQQSTQEAEEALSQGLEALNQSLSDSIVSDSLPPASAPLPPHLSNFMSHMSLALNKLSALEGFVLQVPL